MLQLRLFLPHQPARTIPLVDRAASVIAEQVANIPFVFSRGERGRESMITSGPLVDFYNQPGPRLNRFQYWELRVLWLLLRGECFRVPVYEDPASGAEPRFHIGHSGYHRQKYRLKKILFLEPDRVCHVIQNHELVGWRFNAGTYSETDSYVFLPHEVWHDRLPNPFDNWRGLAPLRAAELPARTDYAAANYMRGIIENNAENGLIVRTDQQLSEEQREQLVSILRNRKRGAGVADHSVLLWGTTEIVQPKLTSADLQFLENRKFSRGEICAALGVPEEIVGTTDHNKYDVMQGARLNFIENRIAPLCARLEAAEQATVRAIDPNATGWFDLDALPIMQQARRDRLNAAKIALELGVPFNEVNRVLDLGFKPLPNGDTPSNSPLNTQRSGAI